ncbi:MAG: DUF4270 family protein [Cytophagaceae bacterium]|nr:MAG: DUF4270 family protein [Cytophagaceae bacterium]
MLRKTKQALSQLLGLGLLLLAAACSSTPGNIGVGLPDANANTGAYLVDTLTIKASTVLRDSIITSSSSSLLVGRYIDPQLGTITAKSYVSFGLNGTFAPDQTMIADSLVLLIKPLTASTANPNTRYGDTTKTQTLLDVRRLTSFIAPTARGYSSPKLTPMDSRVRTTSSNESLVAVVRRARPNLPSLRIRLNPAFRDELMSSGKSRLFTTQEQLDALYPGLALLPAATDNAALVQFDATATTNALILYYHDPIDPSTALNYSFSLSTGRHFYQAEADRTTTLLSRFSTPPTSSSISLGQLSSTVTAQQIYIQGLLGLQTKLEIPYLTNLRNFGKNLIITSAAMTAEIPNVANGTYTNLPPPPTLTVTTTDPNNHQGATTVASGVTYSTAVSTLAGLGQPGYTWSVLTYCQDVLNNRIPNNGMLVNTAAPVLPERVVLGGPNRSANKIQLRLYLISND